jgi:hypothetical protein
VSWADLPLRARIWRLAHAAWSIAQLLALAEIWDAVLTRRRSPGVWASAAFLGVEGGRFRTRQGRDMTA